MKFNELNLSADLLAEIEKAGFVEASPIQEQTIPLALEGKDVIGQAQTGTGKTAAFGLPTLEKIRTEEATRCSHHDMGTRFKSLNLFFNAWSAIYWADFDSLTTTKTEEFFLTLDS